MKGLFQSRMNEYHNETFEEAYIQTGLRVLAALSQKSLEPDLTGLPVFWTG
jgi:hypothetical protein